MSSFLQKCDIANSCEFCYVGSVKLYFTCYSSNEINWAQLLWIQCSHFSDCFYLNFSAKISTEASVLAPNWLDNNWTVLS